MGETLKASTRVCSLEFYLVERQKINIVVVVINDDYYYDDDLLCRSTFGDHHTKRLLK